MKVKLMCKDIPVASFSISETTGRIVSDLHIDNRIGAMVSKYQATM